MSIMIIFFNAHTQVYVRWASLISMPVMQAHVENKTFNAHALWASQMVFKENSMLVWYD
jgi:hypothetical protein